MDATQQLGDNAKTNRVDASIVSHTTEKWRKEESIRERHFESDFKRRNKKKKKKKRDKLRKCNLD